MRSTRSTMLLMLGLLILTVPLSGCELGDVFRFLGGSVTKTVVKIECPQLVAPPEGAIDALAAQMQHDPETATWIDQLDKHLEKLETC